MCVDTKNYSWERPATKSDCGILASHFPGVDFESLLEAMSQDNAVPLTSDLALVGAVMNAPVDDLGMRAIPFSTIESVPSSIVVKLPVMDQIIEWFENTALGTDMWQNASDWSEKHHGVRFHFSMQCDCKLVPVSAYADGKWTASKQRFNRSRSHLFGRTTVVQRETNSVDGLDMTPAQLMMWHRIRSCLEALPAQAACEIQLAA